MDDPRHAAGPTSDLQLRRAVDNRVPAGGFGLRNLVSGWLLELSLQPVAAIALHAREHPRNAAGHRRRVPPPQGSSCNDRAQRSTVIDQDRCVQVRSCNIAQPPDVPPRRARPTGVSWVNPWFHPWVIVPA